MVVSEPGRAWTEDDPAPCRHVVLKLQDLHHIVDALAATGRA